VFAALKRQKPLDEFRGKDALHHGDNEQLVINPFSHVSSLNALHSAFKGSVVNMAVFPSAALPPPPVFRFGLSFFMRLFLPRYFAPG
jgi:hypothetical protein